jgi:hypothetical protein
VTIFAVIFLFAGVQTVMGVSKSIVGNSIASVSFGFLILGGAAFVVLGGAFRDRGAAVVVGGVYLTLATPLILAGVFGLNERSDYDEWREANGLNQPRPPNPEQEDYDDQPRGPDRGPLA